MVAITLISSKLCSCCNTLCVVLGTTAFRDFTWQSSCIPYWFTYAPLYAVWDIWRCCFLVSFTAHGAKGTHNILILIVIKVLRGYSKSKFVSVAVNVAASKVPPEFVKVYIIEESTSTLSYASHNSRETFVEKFWPLKRYVTE